MDLILEGIKQKVTQWDNQYSTDFTCSTSCRL